MRSQTALKIVFVLGLLSVIGAAIAVKLGSSPVHIAEQVGYVWVLAAMVLLEPIVSEVFPRHTPQIAIGVAVLAAVIGALCIVRYSTEHVALSLFTVGIFWNVSERLLMQRPNPWMGNKPLGEVFMHFKTMPAKPRPPLAKVLWRGSIALSLASIACLFTITTW